MEEARAFVAVVHLAPSEKFALLSSTEYLFPFLTGLKIKML
jgi:hypothetical protein